MTAEPSNHPRGSLFFDDSGPVGVESIPSTWQEMGKKKKRVKDQNIQTHLSSARHGRGAQTSEPKNASSQTSTESDDKALKKDDSPGLAAFLRKCEPEISRLLTSNLSIRAFDHYIPNWHENEDSAEALTKSFTLTFDGAVGVETEISAVAWNCNGSVIAVAFGSQRHSTWCSDHKGGVATWNVDRVRMKQSNPDQWQETTSCLMTIEWHPGLPAVLAGGNFLGEILIWNWSKMDEPLLGQTEAETSGHREPISQIRWLPDEKTSVHRRQRLATSGTDGRIVIWNISLSHPSRLIEPIKAMEIQAADIPRDFRNDLGRYYDPGKRETGISSMVLCLDSAHAIVGNETGAIFRANLGGAEPQRDAGNDKTKAKNDSLRNWQAALKAAPESPVGLSYDPVDGPVYSVDFSPFHRNLFLACGSDGTVKMYNQFQASPCLAFTPPEGRNFPLLCVKWSPKRPLVFAICSASGVVSLYDLGKGTTLPSTQFRLNPNLSSPATSLAFNPKLPLIAVGVSDGSTQIWSLPVTLTEPLPHALQILSSIAGEDAGETN